MVSTVNEAHVIFDMLVQESNSEVKRTIAPSYKDYYLNLALMSWIKTRSNNKTNVKQEGLFESVKRIDDLKELEKTYKFDNLYINDSLSLFGLLPNDYMTYVTSYCSSIFNCTKPTYSTTSHNINYVVLKLADNKPIAKDLSIVLNDVTILSSATFNAYNIEYKRADSIFVPINYILQYINSNNQSYKIYWERYDDLYIKGSFIITNTIAISTAVISYNYGSSTYTQTSSGVTKSLSKSTITEGTADKECMLIGHNVGIRGILQNPVKSRAIGQHPIVTIEGNRLLVYHNNKVKLSNLNMIYIKRPTLYNKITGYMPEIKHHEEVINIAVKYYLGSLADPQFQIQERIEQNIE